VVSSPLKVFTMNDSKQHWEHIYTEKQPQEVSWTQEVPETSLAFIRETGLPKSAQIIDIGGGDSKLVDYLLLEGYENITVLDISEKALERVRQRLGAKADKVTWIVTDITSFAPVVQYDCWHDRAAFHFLTSEEQIAQYLAIAGKAVKGYLTIGTFSYDGPTKCSGLTIKQYDETALAAQLSGGFTKIKCITENHVTPFNTQQHFVVCSFKVKAS
jgi:SAM-dependent methyltransferase